MNNYKSKDYQEYFSLFVVDFQLLKEELLCHDEIGSDNDVHSVNKRKGEAADINVRVVSSVLREVKQDQNKILAPISCTTEVGNIQGCSFDIVASFKIRLKELVQIC